MKKMLRERMKVLGGFVFFPAGMSPSYSLKDQCPEGEYLAKRFTNDGLSKRNQAIGHLKIKFLFFFTHIYL